MPKHALQPKRLKNQKETRGAAAAIETLLAAAAMMATARVKARTRSDGETGALIAGGWGEETVVDDGFKNHGQRVSTFVKLAKALGYSASVGAMQANFPGNVEVEAAIPVVGGVTFVKLAKAMVFVVGDAGQFSRECRG